MSDERQRVTGETSLRRSSADSGLRRADFAHDHIKHLLIDGHFRQGDGLPVEQFARDLGMSRQPVMEALKRLTAHGFVEIIPQVGCRVATIDRREVADLFRYLAVTEGLLAELAAVRWNEQQLDALRQSSRAIGDLVISAAEGKATFLHYRALYNAFHDMVGQMANAPLVAQAARRMTERYDFQFATTATEALVAQRLELSHREHEEILHRIERRHAMLAGQALTDHLLGVYRRTFGNMQIC